MKSKHGIVVTGVGVVSPIGVGIEPFWDSLLTGRSGIASLPWKGDLQLSDPIGGAVRDFEPSRYIRPRKNLKVMGREIQLGVAAAEMACTDAKVKGAVAPERLGVVFGADMMITELDEVVNSYRACMVDGKFSFGLWGDRALPEMFPLWMLKYLPNMPACHIGIAHDARGPNNSHTLAEVSSLTALAEAADVIRRGQADVMIAGGVSTRLHPLTMSRYYCWQMSQRQSDAVAACRPFDADRDGMVLGEGSAAFILESCRHAEARGATVLACLLGCVSCYGAAGGDEGRRSVAIRQAIGRALDRSGLKPTEIGHVNAHGLSTTEDDQIEARAIRDLLGDVPVTAPKSSFGNLGAGTGAVEMAASVLAIGRGLVPPTLNYHRPDPACPIRVVHGEPLAGTRPVAMTLNHSVNGQAVAAILASPD
jgi:3-oxoacyl-[acyl-carrier-protein] synthase II